MYMFTAIPILLVRAIQPEMRVGKGWIVCGRHRAGILGSCPEFMAAVVRNSGIPWFRHETGTQLFGIEVRIAGLTGTVAETFDGGRDATGGFGPLQVV